MYDRENKQYLDRNPDYSLQEFDRCMYYFQPGYYDDLESYGCFPKFDIETCNNKVFTTFANEQIQMGNFDEFKPPASLYFECYYEKGLLKNETIFTKEACQNLYPDDQFDLIDCYNQVGVEYDKSEMLKACSSEYTK